MLMILLDILMTHLKLFKNNTDHSNTVPLGMYFNKIVKICNYFKFM